MGVNNSKHLPAIVYGILVVLALAVGIAKLGNYAGWWSLDI